MADAKKAMLDLLDRRVFDPAIAADPGSYPADKRRELAGVQKTARETKASYHKYGSAAHIKSMYLDDLRSPYGQRQTRELRDLGLPALVDVKSDFARIAEENHVK
jgi:hypothetical protein